MKEYTVLIGGLPHTLLLSDEDAKARGVWVEPETKQAPKPTNKARAASNK